MSTISDASVFDWFQKSKAGDCLVYYVGESLAKDVATREVGGIYAVRSLYDSGRVCLTQKKIGHKAYEYRATVRATVSPVQEPYRFIDLPVRRYR